MSPNANLPNDANPEAEQELFQLLDGYWNALRKGESTTPEEWSNAHAITGMDSGDLKVLAALHSARQMVLEDSVCGSTEDNARMDGVGGNARLLAPGAMLGEYRIEGLLGYGGMGEVYLGSDQSLKRQVAIKVLPRKQAEDAELQCRFEKSMQLLAKIPSHPNVAMALHSGEHEGRHFLVMEYVAGTDLKTLVHQSGPLSLAECCGAIRQSALGLEHAHRHNIIHRDIKPSNLIRSPDGSIKIVDLGLARTSALEGVAGDSAQTPAGAVLGTLDYMAPEQAVDSQKADERSDLYSLGCTFYFLLTGSPPFNHCSPVESLLAHAAHEPRPVQEVRPDVDNAVAAVVHKLLAKDPTDRYPSARSVVVAIDNIAAARTSEALKTHEANTAKTTASLPRRRFAGRMLIATAAALLLVIGGGLLASQIIIRLKGKDGQTEIRIPPGTTVEIEKDGKKLITIRPGKKKPPVRSANPLDALDPEDIPKTERFPWQPKELVAVLGEHKWRHWRECKAVAESPDGKIIASRGERSIRIWDLKSGRQLAAIDEREGGYMPIAFTPDGKSLVSSGEYNPCTVKIRNAKTGAIQQKLNGYRFHSLSPDGKSFVASMVSDPSVVHLFDKTSLQKKAEFRGLATRPHSLAFAPDGKTLATTTLDGTVKLWEIATGKLSQTFRGHKGIINAVVFSPNGKMLASGGEDRDIRLWDIGKGAATKILRYHSGEIYSLRFAPDGTQLISGTTGGTNNLVIWNLTTGKVQAHLRGNTSSVLHIVCTANGKNFLTASADGTVRLWDLATGNQQNVLHGHSGQVEALAFSADGANLASSDASVDLKYWDIKTKAIQARHHYRGATKVDSMNVTKDGKVWALWHAGRLGGYWQIPSMKYWFILGIPAHGCASASLSHDGTLFATGHTNGDVHLWNAVTGQEIDKLRSTKGKNGIVSVALSPDGKLLAAAERPKGSITVWDTVRKKELVRLESNTPTLSAANNPHSLVFSPDGAFLLARKLDGWIKLWRVNNWKLHKTLKVSSHRVTFSAAGKLLATTDNNGEIRLWNVATGNTVRLFRMPGPVHGVAFSPNGRYLATGNGNGTIYILRLAPQS